MSDIHGKLYNPNIWNHLGDRIIHTSLPLKNLESHSDPDGQCQFVGRASIINKLVKVPEFPQPVPKLKDNRPIATIRDTKTMGLGVFATRVILPGELVHAERPLLICPTNMIQFINKDRTDDYNDVLLCIKMADQHMTEAVDRMDEERRRAYLSLADDYNAEHRNPDPLTRNSLIRIALTNEFSSDDTTDCFPGYGIVCNFGSRINHR